MRCVHLLSCSSKRDMNICIFYVFNEYRSDSNQEISKDPVITFAINQHALQHYDTILIKWK